MKTRYFAFLRRLRAKGRSNMYGAIPYLMRAFDLDRERAFAIICEWLDVQAIAAQVTPPAPARHIERTRPTARQRRKRRRSTT